MSCKMYLAIIFPASESADGCARLVLMKEMRAAAGMPASAERLPLARNRQSSQEGCTLGGGVHASPHAAVSGSTGGATGGVGRLCPERLPAASPRFVTKVRVCSVTLDAGLYSQHGSTLWPDGAVSNW